MATRHLRFRPCGMLRPDRMLETLQEEKGDKQQRLKNIAQTDNSGNRSVLRRWLELTNPNLENASTSIVSGDSAKSALTT